jgi:uncharacterized DUF497 family protein
LAPVQNVYTIQSILSMAFEWDAAKNAANIAKHGIDFEDAIGIFDGTVLEKADVRGDYSEARIIAFGALIVANGR